MRLANPPGQLRSVAADTVNLSPDVGRDGGLCFKNYAHFMLTLFAGKHVFMTIILDKKCVLHPTQLNCTK